jgi:hypothetical protein
MEYRGGDDAIAIKSGADSDQPSCIMALPVSAACLVKMISVSASVHASWILSSDLLSIICLLV